MACAKGNLTCDKTEAQTEDIVELILERCEPKAQAEVIVGLILERCELKAKAEA